jgi:hypothetical protein
LVTPANAIPLTYREECPGCGANFAAGSLVDRQARSQFQVQLTVTNTGQRGRLDFSYVNAIAFVFDEAKADEFAARFEAERRRGGVIELISTSGAATYTLSYFLDAAGHASTGPVLAVGETWSGWLVFDGRLAPDAKGLVLWVRDIEGDAESTVARLSSGWISYTAGQPFIVIGQP